MICTSTESSGEADQFRPERGRESLAIMMLFSNKVYAKVYSSQTPRDHLFSLDSRPL